SVGHNFLIRGNSTLTIRDVIGPGFTQCISGGTFGGASKIPAVTYDNCTFHWGPSENYTDSPAYLVRTDPLTLVSGDGTLQMVNCIIRSRFNQGSINPNPLFLRDYRSSQRPINVTLSNGV